MWSKFQVPASKNDKMSTGERVSLINFLSKINDQVILFPQQWLGATMEIVGSVRVPNGPLGVLGVPFWACTGLFIIKNMLENQVP